METLPKDMGGGGGEEEEDEEEYGEEGEEEYEEEEYEEAEGEEAEEGEDGVDEAEASRLAEEAAEAAAEASRQEQARAEEQVRARVEEKVAAALEKAEVRIAAAEAAAEKAVAEAARRRDVLQESTGWEAKAAEARAQAEAAKAEAEAAGERAAADQAKAEADKAAEAAKAEAERAAKLAEAAARDREAAKQLGVNYPSSWEMERQDVACNGLFSVPSDSPEFKEVERRLTEGMRGPPSHSGFNVRLLELQRVQNDLLYRRYCHERTETARRLGGDANEQHLWMSSGAIDPSDVALNEHGFDPTYYQKKSYGAGAYFAKWPLYSHGWRPCSAPAFRNGAAGHLIILAQVALGEVKDFGRDCAQSQVREPEKPGGGQYDSWSGTERDMEWSSGDRHKDALRDDGAQYGRQYIVCRYQKAYPAYILRYEMA